MEDFFNAMRKVTTDQIKQVYLHRRDFFSKQLENIKTIATLQYLGMNKLQSYEDKI